MYNKNRTVHNKCRVLLLVSCAPISVRTFVLLRRTYPVGLTFRLRASSMLGQAFRYSPENAFYIFNQQIYFII